MNAETPHVHDCTGPDQTCPCGFKIATPRFSLSIEVYDNKRWSAVVNEIFSTDSIWAVIDGLTEAAEVLEKLED